MSSIFSTAAVILAAVTPGGDAPTSDALRAAPLVIETRLLADWKGPGEALVNVKFGLPRAPKMPSAPRPSWP